MKKILSILPLILITGEAAAHSGTGSHEHPESNTVVIENTVEVFSSRQNVYLCNVAINSKRGGSYLADNRVYATAHRVSRRDSSKDLETPVVLEARPNYNGGWLDFDDVYKNDFAGTKPGFSNGDYFVELSNVRVELASLKYGANLHIAFCLEAPFFDRVPQNNYPYDYAGNRDLSWEISAYAKVLNLLSGSEYAEAAGLRVKTQITCTDTTAQGREWNSVRRPGNLRNTIFDEVDQDVVSNNSVVGELGLEGENSNKCVVQFMLTETKNTTRLKGLTEGVRWQQHLESNYSIGSDN